MGLFFLLMNRGHYSCLRSLSSQLYFNRKSMWQSKFTLHFPLGYLTKDSE